ncbi:hypothetical protein WJX73_000158 [Symbiochloris irregularis]|uniref:Uncharacterized protein n=1 Tax=Symbiochloris irregularis TaxID=706552 RepID=A0AAW1P3X9_9CHLO
MVSTDLASAKSARGFKRLGFVQEYSSYYWSRGYGLASQAYTGTKKNAPASWQPRIKSLEDTVADYSNPAFVTFQDKSDSVLRLLDDKVDYAAGIASRYYSSAGNELSGQVQKQKDYHRDNLDRYRAAREAYLQKIEDTVGFVKRHGVAGTVKYSADSVLAQVEDAKKIPAFLEKQGAALTNKVQEAWNKFYSLPAVQQTLARTKPTVDAAWQKYLAAHDQLLSTTYYHRAVDSGSKILTQAQQTAVYKKAKTDLYPSLAPYADPAYNSIVGSTYYKAAVDHLKPVSSYAAKQL